MGGIRTGERERERESREPASSGELSHWQGSHSHLLISTTPTPPTSTCQSQSLTQMADRKAVLFLLMKSSTWCWCLMINLLLIILACFSLANIYLASLLFTAALLSCWATLQISKHGEERIIPLDLPIPGWVAKLFDIERILQAVNQDPAPPSEQRKCIEEEYFDHYLPVPWLVQTIGG